MQAKHVLRQPKRRVRHLAHPHAARHTLAVPPSSTSRLPPQACFHSCCNCGRWLAGWLGRLAGWLVVPSWTPVGKQACCTGSLKRDTALGSPACLPVHRTAWVTSRQPGQALTWRAAVGTDSQLMTDLQAPAVPCMRRGWVAGRVAHGVEEGRTNACKALSPPHRMCRSAHGVRRPGGLRSTGKAVWYGGEGCSGDEQPVQDGGRRPNASD